MKHKILLFMLFAWCATALHAQYEFLDKYDNHKNCAVTYISKEMLKNISCVSLGKTIFGKNIEKLNAVRTLTYEFPPLNSPLKQDIKTFLTKYKFEELMHQKNKDNLVYLYKRVIDKKENEFVLYTKEKFNVSLIILTGSLDINDLSAVYKGYFNP